jgi:pimeloyl-ACP methyl ester carboxylesterase
LNSQTLIFIHGAGSNSDFWHEQRAAFPDAHYLDLPGHTAERDRSQAGEARQRIEDYADWVAAYVAGAGLKDVVLNGHSMGGAITLALALRHPSWLRAIVLTGTGARLRVSPRLLELLPHDYPAAVDLILAESFANPPGPFTYAQRARLNGVRRQLLRTPQEVTYTDYQACDRFDVMSRVHEIAVPALCIVGTQDRMTPPRYSEYLHKEIPRSRLEVIDEAGHMLPLEKPREYNRALGEFVSELRGEAPG